VYRASAACPTDRVTVIIAQYLRAKSESCQISCIVGLVNQFCIEEWTIDRGKTAGELNPPSHFSPGSYYNSIRTERLVFSWSKMH